MPAFNGSFLSPIAPGNAVITGCGFKPNLVIFHGGGQADPEAVSTTDANIMFGAACVQNDTQIGQMYANLWLKTIAVAGAKISDSQMSTSKCFHAFSAVNTDLAQAAISTFDNDGFTLNFDVAPATAIRVYFTAIQFESAAYQIGSITSPVGPGNVTVSGLPFTPTGVIFITADNAIGESFSLGFDNVTSKFCSGWSHPNGQLDASNALFEQGLNTKSIFYATGVGSIKIAANVTSLTNDGFVLNFSTSAAAQPIAYIVLGQVDCFVGRVAPSGTGSKTASGVGFSPDTILTMGKSIDFGTFPASSSTQISIGGVDRNLNQSARELNVTSPGANRYNVSQQGKTGKAVIIQSGTTANVTSFTADGFVYTWTTSGGAMAFVALRENPDLLPQNGQIQENDMELAPNDTHYMTIGHKNSAVVLTSWTVKLFKNGDQVAGIPVALRENPSNIYTFSFVNDGTHDSQWSLVVYETASPTNKYSMTWKVYKKIVEQTVKLVRNQMNSSGGFFNSGNSNS